MTLDVREGSGLRCSLVAKASRCLASSLSPELAQRGKLRVLPRYRPFLTGYGLYSLAAGCPNKHNHIIPLSSDWSRFHFCGTRPPLL